MLLTFGFCEVRRLGLVKDLAEDFEDLIPHIRRGFVERDLDGLGELLLQVTLQTKYERLVAIWIWWCIPR